MRHLGSLSGTGHILSADKRLGPFDYQVDVWQEDVGLKSGGGTLDGDFLALHQAFMARDPALELEDGGSVKIVITNAFSNGTGEFKTSGPVPGF